MTNPVADLLREARARAGLSQRDLALRARTAQSVVGRIESGATMPSLESVERLLGAAGFELALSLRPKPEPDALIAAYKKDIDRTLLRENLRRTPEERVRALASHLQLATEARNAGRALKARKKARA